MTNVTQPADKWSEESPAVRILLIDDHAIVRVGYRRLLECDSHIEIAGEAASGEEGYRLYVAKPFDVVVTDLSLPGIGGLETIRRIRQRDGMARILVFSVHEEPEFVVQALEAGAMGYVSKSSAPDELLVAINEVAAGREYLCHQTRSRMKKRSADALGAWQQLSPREFEITRLLAKGKTVGEISDLLHLSTKTVANYHTSIKSKLGVNNVAQLTRLAIQHRIVSSY